MAERTTHSLHFTLEEFGLLASLLQVRGLIGVDNPFHGLSQEQVNDRLEQTKLSLIEKQFIEIQADGTVVLDGEIAALVQVVATAPRALVVSCMRRHQVLTRYVHLVEGLIVEQETLEDGRVVLTAVRDRDVLRERLFEYLALPACESAPAPEIILAEEDLAEAQRLALEPEICISLLRQRGIPEKAAGELAEALIAEKQVGSVAVTRRETDEGERGLQTMPDRTVAWLISPTGGWRVLPACDDAFRFVRLMPSSSGEIEQALTELTSSVT